jgi:hypothetical protein
MSQTRGLPLFFAVVILTVYTNCVMTHAAEAHAELRSRAIGESEPLRPGSDWPSPCENESSCICQGATLAQQATPAGWLCDPVRVQWLADGLWSRTMPLVWFAVRSFSFGEYPSGPPLSAQRLRSQLQVFLI